MSTATGVALLVLTGASARGGAFQDALVGYWPFDSYTAEPNPTDMGLPQAAGDAGEGYFDDLSGNDQKAFGVDLNLNSNQVPFQADAGMFGGAFYSESSGNTGHLAVVKHTDAINFNQEDFTISFWEKSQYRDVAGSGWGPGRGRSQWFTKAPWLPNDPDNVILSGYGLNLTQNYFALLTNKDGDNFGQEPLGARYTFPPGTTPAYDSGTWAHWAIIGQYNASTDDYTMTIYLNGVAVDWDGPVGTTFTVPNAIIDNPGDLTIGGFWRNNGWSAQRFISWNMTDGTPEMGNGKGWMDDFAMFKRAFSTGEAKAACSLGKHADLKYPMSDVIPLLDLHLGGSGTVSIGDLTWSYESGLGGTEGAVQETKGRYTVVINGASGTGVTGSPPPARTLITVW